MGSLFDVAPIMFGFLCLVLFIVLFFKVCFDLADNEGTGPAVNFYAH